MWRAEIWGAQAALQTVGMWLGQPHSDPGGGQPSNLPKVSMKSHLQRVSTPHVSSVSPSAGLVQCQLF